MEEDDDYKEKTDMKSWDCAISVLLIGIVPIAIYFVFYNREIKSLLPYVVTLLISAVAVFMLVAITGWVIVGRIIHLLGCILTPLFFYMAYLIWDANDAFDLPKMGEKREFVMPWPWRDRNAPAVQEEQN